MLFGLDFWKMFFVKKIKMDQDGFLHLEYSTDLKFFGNWKFSSFDPVINDVDEDIANMVSLRITRDKSTRTDIIRYKLVIIRFQLVFRCFSSLFRSCSEIVQNSKVSLFMSPSREPLYVISSFDETTPGNNLFRPMSHTWHCLWHNFATVSPVGYLQLWANLSDNHVTRHVTNQRFDFRNP